MRCYRIYQNDNEQAVIVEYPDRPRYEVRLYRGDSDPKTLLFTDHLGKAEALGRRVTR